MDWLFFHLVPRAAAAAWRTVVTVWRWLTKPQFCLPPVPRDENMRGLGWAGDRNEIRPWLVSHMGASDERQSNHEARPLMSEWEAIAEHYRRAILDAKQVLGCIPMAATDKPAVLVNPVAVEISRAQSILHKALDDVIFKAEAASPATRSRTSSSSAPTYR